MLNSSDLRKPEIRQVVMDTLENCIRSTKVDPSLLPLMHGFSYDPDTKMIWFDLSNFVYLNSETLEYLSSLYPYLDIKSHTEKLYLIQDDVLKGFAGSAVHYDHNRFGLTQIYEGYTSDELTTKFVTELLWEGGVDSIISDLFDGLEESLKFEPGTSFSEWYKQGGWEEVAKQYFNNRIHEIYLEFFRDETQTRFLREFYSTEVEIRDEIETKILQYLDNCPRDFEQPKEIKRVRPPKFKPVFLETGTYDASFLNIWKGLTYRKDLTDCCDVFAYDMSKHLYLQPEIVVQIKQQYPNVVVPKLFEIEQNVLREIVDDLNERFERSYTYGYNSIEFNATDTISYDLEAAYQSRDWSWDDVTLKFIYTDFTPINIRKYIYEIDTAIEAIKDRTKLKVEEYLNNLVK